MGEWDDALALFGEGFVPSIQGTTITYARWRKERKGEAALWDAFRDAILRGEQPAPPAMSTRWGKALVAAGVQHMNISRLVGQVQNPYPPPDPPQPPGGAPGTISFFSDLRTDWFSFAGFSYDITMNRYQPRVATGGSSLYHRQPIDATLPPWVVYPNGGGIYEVSTIHGPGFDFVLTPDMWQTGGPAQGWLAHNVDVNHHIPFSQLPGLEQVWSGKFMYPSSGNPDGFMTTSNAGVLVEFHTASASGHHFNLNNGGAFPRFRFGIHSGVGNNYEFIFSDIPTVMDRWYSWRMHIKWTYDTTGFFRGSVSSVEDGDLINFERNNRATLFGSEVPWLQYGLYGDVSPVQNEVIYGPVFLV